MLEELLQVVGEHRTPKRGRHPGDSRVVRANDAVVEQMRGADRIAHESALRHPGRTFQPAVGIALLEGDGDHAADRLHHLLRVGGDSAHGTEPKREVVVIIVIDPTHSEVEHLAADRAGERKAALDDDGPCRPSAGEDEVFDVGADLLREAANRPLARSADIKLIELTELCDRRVAVGIPGTGNSRGRMTWDLRVDRADLKLCGRTLHRVVAGECGTGVAKLIGDRAGGDARPQGTPKWDMDREAGRHVAVDDLNVGHRGTEDADQL